ncbi:MAG: isochorismatase family protein [Prolixibacteraceae bacterium]|nr:isochorismatase family protein [Prolixibacteraceae bacterium]
MRVTRENTVGLIIDFQERLFPAMHENEKLLTTTKILVEGLQQLNIPLLLTQQYTKGLGETIPEIKSLISLLEPIEKSDFSCCDEPLFTKKLSEKKAKNVIICGIESHVCVLQTAVDLKEAGYNPIIVMDCVSSRKPESIETAKERFRFEGIMMTSMESILFELTRSSKNDGFRAISKLVK